jgi:pimeloyl-ACP methyl ester carboxylesterase
MSATDTGAARATKTRPWLRALLALLALFVVAVVALMVVGYRHPMATIEVIGRLALRGAGLEKASVEGTRGPVAYFRGGTGSPVVFIHGANDQAGAWARVVKPVLARHRVLVLDLPGHGDSGPKDGPLGIGDLYAGLEALLSAEAKGQPAVLVGNSLGGFLAMVYAHRHPDQVAGVVLVNGAALEGDGSEAKVDLLPKTREEARAALYAATGPSGPIVADFVLDDLVRRAPGSPLARLMASSTEGWLLEGRLGEIRAPVTLLWGADDRILPLSYAERVAAQLPSARLETMARCGHVPQRQCADRLVPLLVAAGDGGGAR